MKMKNLKHNIYIHLLICAFATQVFTVCAETPTKPAPKKKKVAQVASKLNERERIIFALVQEFIDLSKKPTEKFKYFADEIIKIIDSDPNAAVYTEVKNKLQTMVASLGIKKVNPIQFGLEFKKFQNLLPIALKEEVECMIEKRKIKTQQLVEILRTRLNA